MELEFVSWLQSQRRTHPALALGPGDDAAVLTLPTTDKLVVSTDMLMDGTDFVLADVEPRRVGHKALAVNLSDMAAMAAQPIAFVVSVALPRDSQQTPLDLAVAIYEGMLPLVDQFELAIAGGDTNVWDGALAISVTVFGDTSPHQPWTRGGGQVGDQIVVTGQLGGSLLGRHLDFTPRVAEARTLAEHYNVHAAIDISDGLALDLSRLATASGCGAVVTPEQLPLSAAAQQICTSPAGGTPLEHALGDGEDFELLLALPPEDAQRAVAEQPLSVQLTSIGELIQQPGLWQRNQQGDLAALPVTGYVHE